MTKRLIKAGGDACASCPGRDLPYVPPEPAAGRTHLIVVGESPGANEVREKRPFIGASGRMMMRELKQRCGYDRE